MLLAHAASPALKLARTGFCLSVCLSILLRTPPLSLSPYLSSTRQNGLVSMKETKFQGWNMRPNWK